MNPRDEWIVAHARNKRVLDLGCVRHSIEATEEPGWLHDHIRRAASDVVGVDYLAEPVEQLRNRGYDIVCANVETLDLGRRFDVVIAGDLIEHLNNVGLFLESVKRHLLPGGVFVVTTPNPLTTLRFIGVLLRGRSVCNTEHTCWFTEQVLLQLFERYGFRALEVTYVDDSYQYYASPKWLPFLPLNFALSRLRPRLAETLCVAVTVDPRRAQEPSNS